MPILRGSHSATDIVSDVSDVSDVSAVARTPSPTTAAERLEASRDRLRSAMSSTRRQVALSDGTASPGWLARLENLPVVRGLVDALKNWWSRHPLRPVVTLAHQTTDAIATPVAQSHPIAMVTAGVVIGALVIAARPWRWILKRALFAGLIPQIVASLPIDSWLNGLRVVESRQSRTRALSRTEGLRADGAPSRVVR